MELNDLTYLVRGAIFKVHSSFGPGLFESVYEAALVYELIQSGLPVLTQVGVPVNYNGVKLKWGFRPDILVDQKVIVEVKSVENLHDVNKKQLLTYLKLTGKKLGILGQF